MLNMKLMLVEDDDVLRERLERILRREVTSVRSFSKPSEALENFDEFAPDVIVTDIKMPGMSGLDMVKVIRRTFPDIPVVIASAFSEPNMFLQAIELKVENYVVKPIDVEKLMETLTQIAAQINLKKEFKEKESLLTQYQHIVDVSANISITNPEGIITYVNDRFCQLSGYSRDELIGQPHHIVNHPDMPHDLFRQLWNTILSKKVWQGIIKNRRKDGSTFYVDTTIAPVLDSAGEITEFISIKIDITDLITSRKELEKDLVTDRLSGLGNRIALQNIIQSADNHTMMIIDIDRFRDVNLLFGIHFGDMLLRYVAQCLKSIKGTIELTFFRISSDEFILHAFDEHIGAMESFAYELRRYIDAHPFSYNDVTFDIDFSCAIIHCINTYPNPVEMLQQTVTEAKINRQFIRIFDRDAVLKKEYEENFEWIQKIKSALHDDRMVLLFQPIYDMKLNAISKYECLIRMKNSDGTFVTPDKFLKAAKRSRHYRDLTRTVITKSCQIFSQRNESFSINLSIEDLNDEETLEYLVDTLTRYNMQDRIIIEVLESEGIDNFVQVQSVFTRLKSAGCKIAIDDFGSGYSNFAYLINLPVSILKIDGSLIRNVVTDTSSRVIVQSIVMFAHELGMKCVAEFVSSAEIFDELKALGVDLAQGYYIGKPDDMFVTFSL